MKNMYLAPITEQMDFVSNTVMETGSGASSETWNPNLPGEPGAPKRLGSVGSLGSTGSIRSIGTLK